MTPVARGRPLLERKAAEALGWTLSTELNGQTLKLILTDKAAQPIRGAKGTLSLYLPGETSITVFPLQEVSSGVYQFILTRRMTGEINARIAFEHEGAQLNKQLLLAVN